MIRPRAAKLLATVTLPAAVARVAWTDALARERAGEFATAAADYDRLGAKTSALRMRWRAARAGTDSARVVTGLLALLAPTGTIAQAREALDLIDRLSPALTREQLLVVARRAAAVGRTVHAMDAFMAAAKTESAHWTRSLQLRHACSGNSTAGPKQRGSSPA